MWILWLTVFLAVGFVNADPKDEAYPDVPSVNRIHNDPSDRSTFTQQDAEELEEDNVDEGTRSGFRVDWITQVSSAMRPIPKDVSPGCRRDTNMYLRDLRNVTEWAVRMMDASAKFPHGILIGNIRAMGDFDECLWLKAPAGIVPQYCLANIKLNVNRTYENYPELRSIVRTMTYDRIEKETLVEWGNIILVHTARMDWATCMPASCTASDVESILNGAATRILPNSDIRVKVDPRDCYTDTPAPPFSTRDLAILSAMLVNVLLVVLGTLLVGPDPNTDKIKGAAMSEVLRAFSLRRSWNELTKTSNRQSSQIDCLDGIRGISSVWVLIGHAVLVSGGDASSNKVYGLNIHKYNLSYLMMSAFLLVDTFFLMGGLLRCYTLLGSLENKTVNHYKNALKRYLRFTPVLLAMIGFYIAIIDRIATGPNWSRQITVNKVACELKWWKNVFFVSAFFDKDNYICLIESWYISADMQYFLLSPLLIVPLWKKPRTGFILLGAAAVIATIVQYTMMMNNEAAAHLVSFQSSDVYQLNHAVLYNFSSYSRTVPYLIGIALGYSMYHRKRITLSKIQLVLGWIISVVAFVWSWFGAKPIMLVDRNFDQVEHAVYGSLHKTVWALAVAWLIFVCYHGYGGFINRILCCNSLKYVSRLSYCIYMTNIAVLKLNSGHMRNPAHWDYPYVYRRVVSDAVSIFGCALILHLFVESPFASLMENLFRKSTHAAKKVQ